MKVDSNLCTIFSMPGYTRLRMLDKGDSTVAFVKFVDVAHAANAHKALQEIFFPSPTHCSSGIHIDYANNTGNKVS